MQHGVRQKIVELECLGSNCLIQALGTKIQVIYLVCPSLHFIIYKIDTDIVSPYLKKRGLKYWIMLQSVDHCLALYKC